MKVVLKPEAGEKVAVAEGMYYREFDKKDEPFEISGSEIKILAGTGLFEEDHNAAPAQA